jgi:hypothetical protein
LKNSISYRASTIRIVIAAALAISMLVAGISLAILQRQHQGYAAASQAKQQDQRTIPIYMVTLQREAQANSTQIRKTNVLGLANTAMPV